MYSPKKIILQNSKKELLTFEENINKPFIIKKIDGFFNLPKIKINSIDNSGSYGSKITSKSIKNRNLEIDFYIKNYEVNIENLRNFLNLDDKFEIIFVNDTKIRKTIGDLNDFDVIHNGKGERIGSLEFFCENPFFYDLDETINNLNAWNKNFQFPFNAKNSFEFATRDMLGITNVKNLGNIPSGIKIIFSAKGEVINPSIVDVFKNKKIELDYILKKDDVVEISTHIGNKYAILIRNGEKIDLMDFLTFDSEFLTIEKGDNLFRYGAGLNNGNLDISIIYNQAYYGA